MKTNGLEIAIIGMAGRFPGSRNIDEFWDNLRLGVESIQILSDEELLQSGVDKALINHPQYIKACGKLAGLELFDAAFFGLVPREAEILDPQHRLFLECAWSALEQAGYDSEKTSGTVGVYAGAGMNGYLFNVYTNNTIRNSVNPYEIFLSTDKDFLTTRVSYKLNLEGPSVDVQTACSTSLVAVHIACQSLLSGECKMALAGGVAISRNDGYMYQEGGIYAPDGHCRAFDAKAQGTVAGNGVGIVVLKRLEDAIAENDTIHAVIKGSAINNDGSLKVSYTAPRIDSQATAIRTAQMMAEVEPETITYIEAHGTGTPLGDPIEIAALSQVFRHSTQKTGFCAIGSVKTNIGHLDAAAGIASLIKTVLALKHRQIPPSLHFEEANPQIDFANSPFYVNKALKDWDEPALRKAGVSSFGIGGTNAHVILEEYQNTEISAQAKSDYLLILSAKTPTAIETATTNLIEHLRKHPHLNLADVAYTLAVGRRAFAYRRMVVGENLTEITHALTSSQAEQSGTPSVVFMFSGQGSQYPNMGRSLWESEPVFKEYIDCSCELLKPHLGVDLREILYSDHHQANEINATVYAQPALFVVEYALAQLWMSWGIYPEAMIGHSIGEYVAACIAGVFSLEEALELVAFRGKLMQQQPSGSMLSVSLSEAEVQSWLNEEICLAAINSPSLCVVSGTEQAIATLSDSLTTQGISCRLLHTSHGFHSSLMDSAVNPFAEKVKQMNLAQPKIPMISNVTGTWLTASAATNPYYWAKHLRQPVKFASGITELTQHQERLFLEVGPGNTLSTFTQQPHFLSLPHPKQKQSDINCLLNTLGKLWLKGVSVNWENFYEAEKRYRIPLPTYPFEGQRYWIEPETVTNLSLIERDTDWFYTPSWERDLLPESKKGQKLSQACWLIFIDSEGIGANLAQQLILAGQDVITVAKGESFTELDYRAFTIHPNHKEDYYNLLEDLSWRELKPDYIVHCWGITEDSLSFHSFQQQGFYSLIFLMQALEKYKIATDLQITLITNNLHEVIGGETLQPVKATLLGLCKVIPQEYPSITCRNLDIVLSDKDKLGDYLFNELLTPTNDLVSAYRSPYRWRQIFKPIHLNKAGATIKPEGVYLILGDLNEGLGRVWAQSLPKSVKLILIDSSPFVHDLKTEHIFIQVDIKDEEQVRKGIEQGEKHFGLIQGVFYSTPFSNPQGTAPIQLLELSQCEYNFQKKNEGLYVLAAILKERKIDFCLLQSSLASIIGGLGLAAYGAANAFIDAFAIEQGWLSTNWDACKFAENETIDKGFGASLAQFTLTPSEVWEVTQRVLAMGSLPQVIVSKGNLQSRFLSTKPKEKNEVQHSRPNLANDFIPPRDETESQIAKIWQDILGIEKVGIYDSFFDLGGHSLLAIQVLSRLRETFQVELSMGDLLFETPTVAGLAAAIASKQPLTEIAEVLAEIQDLSLEEIQQQLEDSF
ncbi:type I polyketide synthase [Gloeocapsa sp. PCC 73106]|uniref:type I polyketide synthase n=1 Tax=Gloeocapsa sp. PCC 73106 TaxID=102232 RepID=UPI0002AC948C|nr:type I polyketide synthase [Gloeocapsa sp. PCC 73106]ELR97623.1 polyketide synthase family protein [Gloeocapsa sp. PCC 73106]